MKIFEQLNNFKMRHVNGMSALSAIKPILILGILFLQSCENENYNEINEVNTFDETSFNIIAFYDNIIVGQDDLGVNNYFVNRKLDQTFTYSQNLLRSSNQGFTLNTINSNTVRIENPQNNAEYYELRHVNTINDTKNFDIYTSDGQLFPNVQLIINQELGSGSSQARCPWCWIGPAVVTIVEVIVESTNESDCQTAIRECREAGGLPSTEIEEGFFSDSCKVTCNPKSE
jgi:hypothetical protein